MNKEILMVVDAVSNEKGVDKEIITSDGTGTTGLESFSGVHGWCLASK